MDNRWAPVLPLDLLANLKTPFSPLVVRQHPSGKWKKKKDHLSVIIYLPFNSLPDKSPFQTSGHTNCFESQPIGVANPSLERANGKLENKFKHLGCASYASGFKKQMGGLNRGLSHSLGL